MRSTAMKKLLFIVLPLILGVLALVAVLYSKRVRDAPPTPLALKPDLVIQGGQVRVSGTGFFPDEPVQVSVLADGAGSVGGEIRETRASLGGTVDSASIVLPDNVTSGEHHLAATGLVSGRRSLATVYVRARAPWLTIQSGDLKPRAPIGLIVGGFAESEPVKVSIRPAKKPQASATPPPDGPHDLGTLSTDRVGNSTFSRYKIPYRTPGDFEVVAHGKISGQEVKQAITLSPYQPTFDLSPWSGPPGLRIQLNARGYAPGENVRIFVGNVTQASASVVADQYGNFWGAGKVPVPYDVMPGPLNVRAVGDDSGASTTRQFNVEHLKPWLELTTYAGAPSAPVQFSGGGWAAGEQVAFHIDSSRTPAVAYGQADGYGWLHYAGPVYVPKDALSKITFIAVGDRSHSVATATFTVVLPFGLRPE